MMLGAGDISTCRRGLHMLRDHLPSSSASPSTSPSCWTSSDETQVVQSVVEALYHHSRHPHVPLRLTALGGLVKVGQSGQQLPVSCYSVAVEQLKNPYPQIRLVSVKLVSILADQHGDMVLGQQHQHDHRLVDHGFQELCSCMSDFDWRVRLEAVTALGAFRSVSPHIKLAALSKKATLSVPLGDTKGAKPGAGGGRTTGTQSLQGPLNEGSPTGQYRFPWLDAPTLDNAVGAFVYGLEDDMHQVCIGTIHTLVELSLSDRVMAYICVDHLLDTMTDENVEVRKAATRGLEQLFLAHPGLSRRLTRPQLNLVLMVSLDSQRQVRGLVLEMLTKMTYPKVAHLEQVEKTLMQVAVRYPQDLHEVLEVARKVAYRHAGYMGVLAQQLLPGFHPLLTQWTSQHEGFQPDPSASASHPQSMTLDIPQMVQLNMIVSSALKVPDLRTNLGVPVDWLQAILVRLGGGGPDDFWSTLRGTEPPCGALNMEVEPVGDDQEPGGGPDDHLDNELVDE